MNTIITISNLVRKDIRLQKRTIFFMLFFIIMLLFSFSSGANTTYTSPYITVSIGGAIFWIMSVCSYEGFYKMDRLFASLPISRAQLVYARYASGVLTIINVIAISGIFGGLLTLFAIRPASFIISWVDALASFFGASILLFGYLPVYFKLGYLRSRMVNIAVFAVLGALIVLVSLLVDSLGLSTTTTPTFILILAIVLWAALAFLSVRLSVRFYQKRAL
jgi:ABC-2 type transport system permease protein